MEGRLGDIKEHRPFPELCVVTYEQKRGFGVLNKAKVDTRIATHISFVFICMEHLFSISLLSVCLCLTSEVNLFIYQHMLFYTLLSDPFHPSVSSDWRI